MAESNIIQMHDFEGNNQYPVTLASLVYDEDGETVGKKLALLLDWFEWGDENETSVKTKYHFWSEKQLGAGGIGEEGEGGGGGIGTITGIIVNGEKYDEPDEFGVLTIPDYPTSLEWANINGRPENLSEFNNDKGYITEVTEDMIIAATKAIPNAGKVLISTGGGLGWVLYPRNLSDLTDDVVAGKYLPLTGGTIKGNLTIQTGADNKLIINNTDGERWSNISIQENGVEYGSLLWRSDMTIITGLGSLRYNSNIILHTGNVETYSVKRTDEIDLSQKNLCAAGYGITTSGWLINGPAIAIGHTSGYTMLLQQRTDNNGIYVNRKNPYGIAGDWNVIAFTDSDITGNAASATKLATARTIWGQSFDGTGNVGGALYDINNQEFIYSAGTWLRVGNGTSANGCDTYIDGNNVFLRYGISHRAGLILNSPGNVTIGGGDLAGTNAKLAVWGNQRIYRESVTAEYLDISVADVSVYYNAYDPDGYCHQYFQSNGNTRLFINGFSGNVGIGTSSPDELLHVAGNIRLKNANNYGCYLKFGDSNYCYLHEDSDDHLTIYAYKGIALLTNGKGVTTDTSLTIGSAVLSWDSVNNALKIEGNVYTTGQLSAGGVGTEVQKVFDIAAVSDSDTANQPYTNTLTHNLNTYDLAVVVYEVEEITQTDGTTTEKLTQVLADVILTDENNVKVDFATRKINRKYRIVIIG